MNIKRKSIIIGCSLGILFILLALYPTYFAILFLMIILAVLTAWFYTFDIKSSKKEWVTHNLRFLTLPLLFNLGAALFLTGFFQDFVKVILSIIIGIVNYYLFSALRRVHNMAERAAIFQRNIIISVAFLSIFLSLSAIFRFFVTYSISDDLRIPQFMVVLATSLIFYSVAQFLAWENGLDLKKFQPYNLVTSLLGGEIAWVTSIWIINYPVFTSSEKANLGGNPLPAIILTVVFYLMWGIISHKADKSLTKNVMAEFIFLSLFFLFILILTAHWLPQI